MNIFIRLINFIKDLRLPFSECRQCKHKKYCSHRVWTTPYKDCRYWEIHKFEKGMKHMSNEEKNVLFYALQQILMNQRELLLMLKDDFDPYYTDLAIRDTTKIANETAMKMNESKNN